ncbi:hypothetical protein SAMN05661012_02973 [Chitinophaga sancti]|uniref:Dolichyl-phosphate-mannose-protein mannosyltransferase n=2 Tax=Chitinophaga sancti TaxID=1004 RepID=A0A1K1QPB7_9BACT|nr:hypothetical protein SAMN05661012_02973 [Chitinophaga sancti]
MFPLLNRMNNSAKSKFTPQLGSGDRIQMKTINLVVIAFLITCCLITYQQVFNNDFQYKWDDQWVVINPYTEEGLNHYNLWNVLTEFYHGQYAPVNEFFYILLYSFFGYDPFWFHTASLLVHISNVLLLYFLVLRIQLIRNKEQAGVWRIPFMTALLFAIHPFLVQAVAWMAASKIIIYTLFYLIALHFYITYITTGKYRYYLLVILFFIVSFGAKEQAVTLPVCLIMFDYFLQRNMHKRSVWLEKIPLFLLSIFFGILSIISQDRTANIDGQKIYPFYQRIILASYTLIEYLTKCLLPFKLSYLYVFPNNPGEPLQLRFWIYPIILLVMGYCLYRYYKQLGILLAGFIFFLIHIGIVLNLFSLKRFELVADRYAYLAAAGVFFSLAWLFEQLILKKVKLRKLYAAMIIVYCFGLGIYAYERTFVWHDSDTLKAELRYLLDKERAHFLNKSDY